MFNFFSSKASPFDVPQTSIKLSKNGSPRRKSYLEGQDSCIYVKDILLHFFVVKCYSAGASFIL